MRFTALFSAVFLVAASPAPPPFDLDATFRSVLAPEQAQALAGERRIEALAHAFSPQQHQAIRAHLREAEERTRDPRALSEIHRGYLALREADSAWRVADALVSRFPESSTGYAMRGQAAELRGDAVLAAEEAREALRLNPNDRVAHALLRLTEGRSSTTKSVSSSAAGDSAAPSSGGVLTAPRNGASAEALSLMRQAVHAREAARSARAAGDTARASDEMARVQALAQAAMNGDPKSATVQEFYGLVQKDRDHLRREQVGFYAAIERSKAEGRAKQEVAAELDAARRVARRHAVPPLAPLGTGAVLLTLGLIAWDRGLRDAAREQARQFAAGTLIVLGCAGIAYSASTFVFSAPRGIPPALSAMREVSALNPATETLVLAGGTGGALVAAKSGDYSFASRSTDEGARSRGRPAEGTQQKADVPAKEQWHKGTFDSVDESIEYHLQKHGKGRSLEEYTNAAMRFFRVNRDKARQVVLKDGTKGLQLRGDTGGYWTENGKLVTFWD